MRFVAGRRGDEIRRVRGEADTDAGEIVVDGVDVLTAEGEIGRDVSIAAERRVDVAEVVDSVDVNGILHVLDVAVRLITAVPVLAVLREKGETVRR